MPIILQAWLTLLLGKLQQSNLGADNLLLSGYGGPPMRTLRTSWASFLQAGRGPKVERALRLRRADIPPALSADASTRPMKGLGRAVISAGYLGNSARQEA